MVDNILLKSLNSLKQRSIQTLLILIVYLSIASFLPLVVNQFFYTISLLIKDILIWIMPLTVGFFIASAVTSFERRAPLFILTLVLFEAFSNLSCVWYAYGTASIAADYLPAADPVVFKSDFSALWKLSFERPSWWSAEKGSIVGLLLGCVAAFNQKTLLQRVIVQGKKVVEWLLTNIFSRLIPFFILGFTAHMYQTKMLSHAIEHYSLVILWLTPCLFIYIIFLFALGAGLSFQRIVLNIKNLLPACGIAVLSGCSLSTMPWTIKGTEKNLQTPSLATAVIPATTNIQMVGDCMTHAFLCFVIYRYFYGQNPDIAMWANFSIVFVLARFATAAVLGGAIFIMLPIYESYLNFNAEMIAIILALNIILDPLITVCNVIANGALCRVFEKAWESTQAIFAFSRL